MLFSQSFHLLVSCSSLFPPTGFLQFCQCLCHRSNFWLQNPVLLVPFSNEEQKQVTCDVTNICITHAGLNHDVTNCKTIIMTACTAFDLDLKKRETITPLKNCGLFLFRCPQMDSTRYNRHGCLGVKIHPIIHQSNGLGP